MVIYILEEPDRRCIEVCVGLRLKELLVSINDVVPVFCSNRALLHYGSAQLKRLGLCLQLCNSLQVALQKLAARLLGQGSPLGAGQA